jgi:hypothetical protein
MKTFDCVKFQDDAALRIYEEIKDLSFEEQLKYWRRVSEETAVWRKQIIEESEGKGNSE